MKRKGFTLIELLAVIVILAIIALIAVPVVMNIIAKANKSAFKDTGYGIVKAGELYYADALLEVNGMEEDQQFEFPNNIGNLQIKGNLPSSGNMIVNKTGQVEIAISNGKYCVKKGYNDSEVTIDEDLENCKLPSGTIIATSEKCFETSDNEDNTLTITKYLCKVGNTNSLPEITDVVIPKKINNKSITIIGTSLFYSSDLTSVIIPDSVKIIGTLAFYNNQLKSVVIPDSVTNIYSSAFSANKLENVIIPNSVTSIGDSAFSSNQLRNVTLGNGITTIAGSTFRSNKLTNVVIPVGVTSIGYEAFMYNELISVTLPTSVTSIGRQAFQSNQLASITIPTSVTTIDVGAFSNNKLSEAQAFIYKRNSDGGEDKTTLVSYGGSKKDNVIIPTNVTAISDYTFYSNQLTSITISNNVKTIGKQAFRYNLLTSITIPNSVTMIDESAFSDNKLSSVSLGNSIQTIGYRAFYSNNNINSITIPNSILTIGSQALHAIRYVTVNKPTNSISGSPWGAFDVEWNG